MNDPLVLNYQASELRIAAEFFTNWLPFLTRDLCGDCKQTLADRIRSLDPEVSGNSELPSENTGSDNFADPGPVERESHEVHDNCDTNSLGSWKDCANDWVEDATNDCEPSTPAVRMSWADMAQEDELAEEAEGETGNKQSWADECDTVDGGAEGAKVQKKPVVLPREQREYIRFMNVVRKKDFICLERIKGKIVNILDGLELHSGVFSAAEQKRIVEFVYELQEMGRKGQLKERTYSEPLKWMRGKGRITIQFGCCYNYATDKNGNPPGILRNEFVDPIPHLFKVIIRRLVGWHVLPPTCVPDSCIVNIYEEGDCIPPHIDNHDFVRPFCTVSFLSECDILFGSNLKIVGPGEFSGSTAIPLPVGSVLVLNGNGADVAKHCVPAVPKKRISITFRKMDEKKLPFGFVPEPDLQHLHPLPYGSDKFKTQRSSKSQPNAHRHVLPEDASDGQNQYQGRGPGSGHLRRNGRARSQPANRPRVRIQLP